MNGYIKFTAAELERFCSRLLNLDKHDPDAEQRLMITSYLNTVDGLKKMTQYYAGYPIYIPIEDFDVIHQNMGKVWGDDKKKKKG